MTREIIKDLQKLANPERAKILAGFFKTGPGEYGEGDVFLGIRVPDTRKIAKKYAGMDLAHVNELLQSKIHEHRLAALLILVEKYQNGDRREKERIFRFYLANTAYVNNWDLVDLSADKIIGAYLLDRDKTTLYRLARSSHLWERRIAIVATFAFIKKGRFQETFRIAQLLLNDPHDLIHKAVGWMLREVGKRNQKAEEEFLQKLYTKMPRTMLRYAIERFDKEKKKRYMRWYGARIPRT